MPSLHFMVVVAMFVAIAFNAIEGNVTSESVQYNRECTAEKMECSNGCRVGENAIDRTEVIQCLRECRIESEDCEESCNCISKCEIKSQPCQQKCNSTTPQDPQASEDCIELCAEEVEKCMDLCGE